MKKIVLKERIPFKEHYDVIVVGGGAAGVAAALASKRLGRRVLIIEKSCILGGMATLGLVVLYYPALENKDGRKLVGGIAEEMLHLSIKYGYDNLPSHWYLGVDKTSEKGHYQTVFNAQSYALAMTELLCQEGVDILFDALFSTPIMEEKICNGVVVDTKAGKYYYSTDVVVDASGDADVFWRAGIPCVVKPENWLSYWTISTSLERMSYAIDKQDIAEAMHIEKFGARAHESGLSSNELLELKEQPRFGIRSPEEVSDMVIKGQLLAIKKLHTFDRKKECYVTIPGMPQYRRTRAIKGLYTLDEKDRNQHMYDSIGCTAEDQLPQYCIEIPYRSLISAEADNLISAGRIISSGGVPRDTTRLIAICSLTGEAAGTAAALASINKSSLAQLNVEEIQSILERNGNIIHS